MDRVGERWWPVLGSVYFLEAVKRVRGMRLIGLARNEREGPRAHRRWWPIAGATPWVDAGDVMAEVVIYADGACRGNPGPGGWGAWLQQRAAPEGVFGGEKLTTNNRMELTAVIEALASLKRRSTVDGLHRQRIREERHHDLDPRLEGARLEDGRQEAGEEHRTVATSGRTERRAPGEWRWVRGHAGDPGNERADRLANRGIDTVKVKAGLSPIPRGSSRPRAAAGPHIVTVDGFRHCTETRT
jgi:ribonuclease HI